MHNVHIITCLTQNKYDIYVIRNVLGKKKGVSQVPGCMYARGWGGIQVRTECNMGGGGV